MGMTAKGRTLLAALLLACTPPAVTAAEIGTEQLIYEVDGTEHVGHLAYPVDAEQPRPGVLVVHEWWGMNEHARASAERLAEAGYVALALDMYGEGAVADHPEDAGAMAAEVRASMDRMQRRFRAARAVLRGHARVDGDRVAAIGYCFGGGVVLEMARRGADLAGVASFHGALSTDDPARPGDIRAPILVLHGGADRIVGDAQVRAFREEMERAGADYEFIEYPGAPHSFTNPAADEAAERFDLPVGYDQRADRESWQALEAFLAEVFGE